MTRLSAVLWERPRRTAILALAIAAGMLFIGILTLALPAGSPAAMLLLDHHANPPPGYPFVYPFTVQNLTHLILFIGLGEVFCRWRSAVHEHAMLDEGLLPQAYEVVLQSHDLPAIRARVADRHDGEQGFLPGLVDLCILQFQASRSVDQTVSVLNSSLELMAHRVDLRYSLLRYLVWLIPTVGFIGTVIGIALALAMIDPTAEAQPLGEIARALGVSFYTTLVALAESAILVLLLHLVQAREELAVNQAGHYTLVHLINRLYAGR
ncbi:MotA/TolQ/ExbB proton channel family protein [Thiocapsa sp.]|uniref:MotA/TolQ/ExbB proton channel family protein n=1 Tax=Thiocapsa sp. TaxID=2024551 RepID=UPI0026205A3F|nr:MotA/TolQ/ExbB proton channel family protein [Thiocapsa sp.]